MGWLTDPFIRFDERIIKDKSGCWFWQGRLNAHGIENVAIGHVKGFR